MTERARWHGTVEELRDLEAAGRRNCSCQMALCPVHRMIRHDQRALDGLVFGRRIAGRLIQEELGLAGVPAILLPQPAS